MGQFKVFERGRLAYTNDFYNRDTRHDVAKMADFVSLVKAKIKQANDSKKKRKEDVENSEKKRREEQFGGIPSVLGSINSSAGLMALLPELGPGPSKLDDAKLLLSIQQQNSPDNKKSSSDALADLLLKNLSKNDSGNNKNSSQIPQNNSTSNFQQNQSNLQQNQPSSNQNVSNFPDFNQNQVQSNLNSDNNPFQQMVASMNNNFNSNNNFNQFPN